MTLVSFSTVNSPCLPMSALCAGLRTISCVSYTPCHLFVVGRRCQDVGPGVGVITSGLYCNCLLGGIADGLMRRLQAVQNAAARLITSTRRWDHIIPILRQLQLVRQRVEFKLAILVFETLHGLAPQWGIKIAIFDHYISLSLKWYKIWS